MLGGMSELVKVLLPTGELGTIESNEVSAAASAGYAILNDAQARTVKDWRDQNEAARRAAETQSEVAGMIAAVLSLALVLFFLWKVGVRVARWVRSKDFTPTIRIEHVHFRKPPPPPAS